MQIEVVTIYDEQIFETLKCRQRKFAIFSPDAPTITDAIIHKTAQVVSSVLLTAHLFTHHSHLKTFFTRIFDTPKIEG